MKKIVELKKKLEENIIFKIVKFLMYFIVILLLIVIVVQKITKNNLALGGFRVFTVISESMLDEYKVGDILISKSVTVDEINVGDNVTYLGQKKNLNGLVITHKVIKKEERDGISYFITKGNANEVSDPEITYDQIYGKVVYKMVFLSLLSRLLNSQLSYYLIFITVGIIVSIEIVSSMFDSSGEKEEDERRE